MKRLFFLTLLAVTLSWIAYIRTDGFSFSLISDNLELCSSPPLTLEVKRALSQPYHYLGKGRQAFVFESEDGATVLKLFNQKYFRMPWYTKLPLPKKWITSEKLKREQRREYYLHSYSLAFHELKEETGILYLHFGYSQTPLPSIQVTDKANRTHRMDLNELPFVLQKKGRPLYEGVEEAYAREGLPGLYRVIDGFLRVISSRIEKGIADADHDVEHNWGLIGESLLHLDPGRLHWETGLREPARRRAEWWSATHRFRIWLQAEHPDAVAYFDQSLHLLDSNYVGKD